MSPTTGHPAAAPRLWGPEPADLGFLAGGGQMGERMRALGQAEDQQRAMAAGFDAHLIKPVDLAALERALAGMSVAMREL